MRKIVHFLVSFLLVFVFIVPAYAVDYPAGVTPKVQVKVNLGNTSYADKNNFIANLTAALRNKGIVVSKLDINVTTSTSFSAADSSQWYRYDHIGDWNERYSYNRTGYSGGTIHYAPTDETTLGTRSYTTDPHIIARSDGTLVFYGYGSPGYRDFLISQDDTTSDKHFTFTLDESAVSYHSMMGGGFLFGVTIDDGADNVINTDASGTGNDDTMSGYAIMYIQGGIALYRFSGINIDTYHDGGSGTMTQIGSTYTKPTGTIHDITIDINEFTDANTVGPDYKLTVKDKVGSTETTVINQLALPTYYGNRFGPIAMYNSHGCSELSFFVYSNLQISTAQNTTDTLYNSVDDITWDANSTKYLINLDDMESKDWTSGNIGTMGTELANDNVYYVPVGTNNSSTNEAAAVTGAGRGQSFSQSDASLVSNLADYIFNQIKPTIIDNVKTYAQNNVNDTSGLVDYTIVGDSTFTASNTTVSGLVAAVGVDDSNIINRDNVEIKLTIVGMTEAQVPSADLTVVQNYVSQITDNNIGIQHMDIDVNKYINGGSANPITETTNLITITVPIPSGIQGFTNYKIVRVHNGIETIITPTLDSVNHTLTFQTNKFSTYTMVGSNTTLPGGTTVTPTETPYTTPSEPTGNRAPVGRNYTFNTPKNSTFTGRVEGTDPDNDTVWYQLLGAGSTSGTLVFNPDGSFSFTPDASSTGPAYFSYQVCDTWKCSVAYSVKLTNTSGLPDTGIEDHYGWLYMFVGIALLGVLRTQKSKLN